MGRSTQLAVDPRQASCKFPWLLNLPLTDLEKWASFCSLSLPNMYGASSRFHPGSSWGFRSTAAVLIRRGCRDFSLHMYSKRRSVSMQGGACHLPTTKLSPGTELTGTLIWDFWISETVRYKFLLFKAPSLWYFVTALQTDKDSNFLICLVIRKCEASKIFFLLLRIIFVFQVWASR